MSCGLSVILSDELFGNRSYLIIGDICEIQIGLLVFQKNEIERASMALVASVGTDHREAAAHKSGRISRGGEAEWRQYNSISPTSTLHQKIGIPSVRHGQREVDSELLAADSGTPIDNTLDSAIGRKRCTVARPVGVRLDVPALIGAAVVISTPGLLNFISPAHEFIFCADTHVASAKKSTTLNLRKDCKFMVPHVSIPLRLTANAPMSGPQQRLCPW
jgi:hypothetical protein